ncbi:MAG: PAS domain S-box protein [Thermodesulfobacteriota bacterium]|nr:PAS domain S-box protein [Thermodesulfobacteriota bacterium]
MSSPQKTDLDRTGLRAARRILTQFNQEADLDEIAAGILRSLINMRLLDTGLLLYREGPEEVLSFDGPADKSPDNIDLDELRRDLAGFSEKFFWLPADKNPLGGEPGPGLALALGSERQGFLVGTPHPASPSLTGEDWDEIGSAAYWALSRTAACQRLETSHARYQRLFERSKDFLYVTTTEGRWLEVNRAGVEMLGYDSKAELMTLEVNRIYLDSADRDRLMSLLRSKGSVKDFETTFVRKDGRPVDVLITAARWEEGPGRAGVEGIIRDVTPIKKNLQDLKLAQQTTEGVIEGTPVAMFVLDGQGRVSHWNKACEALTGVDREEILGTRGHWRPFCRQPEQTMADLVLEGDLANLRRLYQDKDLRPSSMVPGGYMAEDRFVGPGGLERDLFISTAPISDPDGRSQGAVQVLLDISDRSRLEEELKHSEAKYRQMVEQAWEGIVIHDNQAIYFVNRCFREMFGLAEDEDLSGALLHRFLAPDTRRSLFEVLQAAEQTEDGPVIVEGRGIRRDGSLFELELSTVAAAYLGRPVLQTVIGDITRRKEMEEQLIRSERLAAAGQLALNIAHEINNPLGGVITYTHLLLEDMADRVSLEQLTETAEKTLKLANRCKIIVGSLLDFAREDRNGLEETNLNTIIGETLSLLEGHIIMKGLDVVKSLDPRLPLVSAHRVKMEQVFMNLIINAAEAMEGRGRLEIKSFHDEDEGLVKVRISDTGRGVPEDIKKRLFEPFFSTKSRGRGTGLGLAISHGIINQHKGRIDVESQVGQGSSFTICLPAS